MAPQIKRNGPKKSEGNEPTAQTPCTIDSSKTWETVNDPATYVVTKKIDRIENCDKRDILRAQRLAFPSPHVATGRMVESPIILPDFQTPISLSSDSAGRFQLAARALSEPVRPLFFVPD